MNDKTYRWILYFIVAIIMTTIGIQVYWNYKNYQTNKQQLIRDVQVSLDKAVDDYYSELAERTTLGVFLKGDQQNDVFKAGGKLKMTSESNKKITNLNSVKPEEIEGITVLKGFNTDSMATFLDEKKKPISLDSFKTQIKELKESKDELSLSNIEMLTSKVMISIKNDSLDVRKVNRLLNADLQQKNLGLEYTLFYYHSIIDKNSQLYKMMSNPKFNMDLSETKYNIYVQSKSKFLPKESQLKLGFSNETQNILKRSLVGILISTLLILAVISCLFYLLHIIKQQKQLAEVKNDLISNITHEFKTPISTISVALESLKNFNAIGDKVKTQNYLNISNDQLAKLNIMVEKLLETATLDSEHLDLHKEPVNVVELLQQLVDRHHLQNDSKQIDIHTTSVVIIANVDPFHFENAINNIIDNALKYGGEKIRIDLLQNSFATTIAISDTGNSLKQINKEKLFEKFYRVPKGNTHDVKGFGIGLYYTKKIIEKHGGTIVLKLDDKLTTFKTSFPNE